MTTDNLRQLIKRKMNSLTDQEVRDQYSQVLTGLACFLNDMEPRIMDSETSADEIPTLFLKLGLNLGTEALASTVTPGGKKKLTKKFEELTDLIPILHKFSQADDLTEYSEIKDQAQLPGSPLQLRDGTE